MTAAIRRWTQTYRYETTLRALRVLSPAELQALGVAPSQFEHLALEVSRA